MKAPEDAPKNLTSCPVSFTPTVIVLQKTEVPLLIIPAKPTVPPLKSPVIKSHVPLPIIKQQAPVVSAQPALYPRKTFADPVETAVPAKAPTNTLVVAPFCVSPALLPMTVL